MPEALKLNPVTLDAETVLNRTERKWPGWWDNFALNLPLVRPGKDVSLIPKRQGPALVVGAGPSFGIKQIRALGPWQDKLTIITADRMLKPLLQVGIKPAFVATVDGDPSVADFYDLLAPSTDTVLNAVTVHPDTVKVAQVRTRELYWFISFFDDPQLPRCGVCQRVSPTAGFHFMSGRKTILQALGNVGALCWHLAYYLGCNPVILAGMDYSYQPGTPIETTHYYDAYLKIAAKEHIGFEASQPEIEDHVRKCLKCKQRVRDSYETKTNPDFKQEYMIDKIWSVYRDLLLPFIARAKTRTINCSGGALHGPGITGMELGQALGKYA